MISGKKIYLRALEPEDLEYLYKWENDPKVWSVSGTVAPFSRYALKCYIENGADPIQTGQIRMMVVESATDTPVGIIDLFDIDYLNRRAGVGVLLYSEHSRGHGYASEAIDLIISHSFKVMGLHQLYANITPDNIPSIKLFEGRGFKKVGVKEDWLYLNGSWCSEALYQLIDC